MLLINRKFNKLQSPTRLSPFLSTSLAHRSSTLNDKETNKGAAAKQANRFSGSHRGMLDCAAGRERAQCIEHDAQPPHTAPVSIGVRERRRAQLSRMADMLTDLNCERCIDIFRTDVKHDAQRRGIEVPFAVAGSIHANGGVRRAQRE